MPNKKDEKMKADVKYLREKCHFSSLFKFLFLIFSSFTYREKFLLQINMGDFQLISAHVSTTIYEKQQQETLQHGLFIALHILTWLFLTGFICISVAQRGNPRHRGAWKSSQAMN